MYSQSPEELQREKELLIRLNHGDERAFEKLYELYSVRILKKLIRLLKDEEIAKELLQDIFLKIWEKRATIDPEKSFRSYLFRIAENQVTDLFRRSLYDRKLLDHLIAVSTELCYNTEEAIDYQESSAVLKQAIATLPPQRKKIFTLCKIEGKSYEEVAKMLDISVGTVNDHMVKAIRMVRKHFAADDVALILLAASIIERLK